MTHATETQPAPDHGGGPSLFRALDEEAVRDAVERLMTAATIAREHTFHGLGHAIEMVADAIAPGNGLPADAATAIAEALLDTA